MPNSLTINNNDPLMLDLAFKTVLSKEEDDAVIMRKTAKAVAALGCALIMGTVFPWKEYSTSEKDNLWKTGFIVSGNAIRYSIRGAWLFLSLENELIPKKYLPQAIARETREFKILKHFFSIMFGSIGFSQYLYDAYNAHSFYEMLLFTLFFVVYSSRNIYGYYLLFNFKNEMELFFSDDSKKSAAIVKQFNKIIDDAIPTLLSMTQAERKSSIKEIYNSAEVEKISLTTMLSELKILNKNDGSAFIGYNKIIKLFYCAALLFSVLYAIFYPVVVYKSTQYFNDTTTLLFSLATMPASFSIEFMLANQLMNKLINVFYIKKLTTFSERFHEKINYFIYFIAFIAFITFASFLSSFFNLTKNAVNLMIGVTLLLGVLLHEYITSDILFNSLITNYYELYDDNERKDIIRLLDFINFIKKDVLQKANYELINECFNKPENYQKLLGLGFDENLEPTPVVSRSLCISSSSGHRDGFFSLGRDGSFGGTLSASTEAEQLLSPEEQGLSEEGEHNGDFVREYPREEKFYCAIM